VHGEQDRLIPPANARTLARRIPGARYCSIANAGHILMTDQPEACRTAILHFLQQGAAGFPRT